MSAQTSDCRRLEPIEIADRLGTASSAASTAPSSADVRTPGKARAGRSSERGRSLRYTLIMWPASPWNASWTASDSVGWVCTLRAPS